MNIEFTARHFNAPDELREHAEMQVERFKKHFERINNCYIVLTHENSIFTTEINLHIPQHDLFAKSSSNNGFQSIDDCIEKIDIQIAKIVDRWKKHR
ncbi:MAG: ribosome-associated translation inhibitor RaiA [Candidatus Marinimicrobia bacterium]|jgi:putative sigma-54 modulation protein|nr:ribosome-associated translation inhibitor RaiA [Candidatus Neomarinimicrobiota bacterium]MBT3676134.1 ribosome-associated translation inhibitor RaiA [Candidatus Neomarinimicrobiota bacterium]MBT4270731.1 ribosome-associated translation inhibitor RaiA [Candidatus Neomarinimicrobiota bacterium]MBT4372977.1 ribosome-associated translation inhibitor RaiA [Candidatus Neomarinimicrobiota bacterium]MBT4809187.1 ribosome-associated translation inhibitor RaiA [Candidatus Neomarinimicrobiota bacterium